MVTIVSIISIAIVVIAIVIVLTILVYNQMLLLNEVNKRLLLLAQESRDNEINTISDLNQSLSNIESSISEINNPSTNIVEHVDNDLDI